jgi:hypothetical protein
MTREELKAHCLNQIEMCKTWAIGKGEEPSGKIYEEHKLILELLEQEPILDKIRVEIVDLGQRTMNDNRASGIWACRDIIDRYKAEMEKI